MAIASDLASFKAESLRREAAIAIASHSNLAATAIEFPADIPTEIKEREQGVLNADVAQLSSAIQSLQAQRSLKKAEYDGLTATITAQKQLIETQDQRVTMRNELVDRAAGSKANLIDALETMQFQQTSLTQQEGQRAQAEAGMTMAEKDIQKTIETFISDNSQKLADAERQADEARERLAKAEAELNHMRLEAPISGVVQGSVITNVDQVVTVGEELMRIVPDDSELNIEAYMPNRDISFVAEGQPAIIKVEAFPFTRYGTIKATVARVGRDAIPEPDAEQTEEHPSEPTRTMSVDGAERVQNLVFPITLKLSQTSILVDGARQPLTAGMAVTAEIRTGSRRILEYLFSPLVQMTSTAMHER
jgi:hemolysin D